MKQRAILIAAGEATRWGNYLNTPKHFIEIDGEKILHRAVRLLREEGIDDVWVVGKTEDYNIPGAQLYIPHFTPAYHDADKFLSSRSLWLRDGRTMVLYGDCYFTKDAMHQIINNAHRDWMLFARPFDSKITGGSGECFAQCFYPENIEEHERKLLYLVELFDRGVLNRIGGWEHYRAMVNLPEDWLHRHVIADRFYEINDWTDDFDKPSEYEEFIKRRAARCACSCHGD